MGSTTRSALQAGVLVQLVRGKQGGARKKGAVSYFCTTIPPLQLCLHTAGWKQVSCRCCCYVSLLWWVCLAFTPSHALFHWPHAGQALWLLIYQSLQRKMSIMEQKPPPGSTQSRQWQEGALYGPSSLFSPVTCSSTAYTAVWLTHSAASCST